MDLYLNGNEIDLEKIKNFRVYLIINVNWIIKTTKNKPIDEKKIL